MPLGPGFGTFLGGCCCCKCYCSRCADGTAPEYWTANILGVDYILIPLAENNNLQNCVYGKLLGEIDENGLPSGITVGCDVAGHILLSLSETIEDYRWFLSVHGLDGTILHFYSFVIPDFEPVNCQSEFTLLKTGGSCGGSDTVTITPGPVGVECEDCDPADSSGSIFVPVAPAICGCCDVEFIQEWELNIPSALWTNPSPPSAGRPCGNCGVQGLFSVPFFRERVGGNCRCEYVYFEPDWCEEPDFCSKEVDLKIRIYAGSQMGFNCDFHKRCIVSANISLVGCFQGIGHPGDPANVSYVSRVSDIECNPIPLYLSPSSYQGGRICNDLATPPPIIYATPIAA